jgi:hypothetical protein
LCRHSTRRKKQAREGFVAQEEEDAGRPNNPNHRLFASLVHHRRRYGHKEEQEVHDEIIGVYR